MKYCLSFGESHRCTCLLLMPLGARARARSLVRSHRKWNCNHGRQQLQTMQAWRVAASSYALSSDDEPLHRHWERNEMKKECKKLRIKRKTGERDNFKPFKLLRSNVSDRTQCRMQRLCSAGGEGTKTSKHNKNCVFVWLRKRWENRAKPLQSESGNTETERDTEMPIRKNESKNERVDYWAVDLCNVLPHIESASPKPNSTLLILPLTAISIDA